MTAAVINYTIKEHPVDNMPLHYSAEWKDDCEILIGKYARRDLKVCHPRCVESRIHCIKLCVYSHIHMVKTQQFVR